MLKRLLARLKSKKKKKDTEAALSFVRDLQNPRK